MLKEWIIFCLVVLFPVIAAVNGKREKWLQPANRFQFYLKDIMVSAIVLAFFYALKPSIYFPLHFSPTDKGINISEDVLSGILPAFFIPLVLSFTTWSNHYPKDITTAKELFGFPISYLPETTREYLLFVSYIIAGVFFEELMFRQFMFYSLKTILRLNGDMLVVVSSLLFAVGHLYQGWKGILSNFILALVVGKVYLIKGTLAYPIVLHLFLNLTLVVLAFRRMKDLKKINYKRQTLI